MIDHVFFDIGGVLGTNGWDHEQRRRAVAHFALDPADFEYRHQETVGDWEEGRMTLEEYLDITVFFCPRPFTREAFWAFMCEQSQPDTASLAVARALRDRGGLMLMTLNNESAELNSYRIERFGLCGLFSAFMSSCWLESRKPSRRFYERAFAIAQATPARTLLIDDREQNLAPARHLGAATIHFESPERLSLALSELGVLP